MKFHLPDHEAAHCLLSLSQTSPSSQQSFPSPNMLVPGQPMTYPYARSQSLDESQRSATSAGSTTSTSETKSLLSIVQSGKSVDISSQKSTSVPEDSNNQPIDLTKPRVEPSTEERKPKYKIPAPAPPYAGPAAFLNSLISNSDKVPPPQFNTIPSPIVSSSDYSLPQISSGTTTTNSAHMQTYLTEQALQKVKMKLSQINSNEATNYVRPSKAVVFKETTPPLPEKLPIYYGNPSSVFDQLKRSASDVRPAESQRLSRHSLDEREATRQEQEQMKQRKVSMPQLSVVDLQTKPLNASKVERKTSVVETKVTSQTIDTPSMLRIEVSPKIGCNNIDDHSGMDTLAEIAASSVKLDTSVSPSAAATAQPKAAVVNVSIVTNVNNLPELPTESNAKRVASEYLKMTLAEYNKAYQEHDGTEKLSTDDNATNFDESPMKKFGQSMTNDRNSPATATALISARTVVVGEDGFKTKSSIANSLPVMPFKLNSNTPSAALPVRGNDGGRSVCSFCSKAFQQEHQMLLHMNVHFVNPHNFKCESCNVSFKTQVKLQKHEKSDEHIKKVNGQRPFKCIDCKRPFRQRGHLTKHLRCKGHVQNLEGLKKLPDGTYAAIERSGNNLLCIDDTIDCDAALSILTALAHELGVGKESTGGGEKPSSFIPNGTSERTESMSEEGDPIGSPAFGGKKHCDSENNGIDGDS